MAISNTAIAIMGIEGSYHDTAASHYFGDAYNPQYHGSFDDVFDAVAQRSARYGVTAIENSIVGALPAPHDLLRSAGELTIVGEISLGIHHSLAAVPGTRLTDIEEVRSHPVALAQCGTFLEEHLPNAIRRSASDTSTALLEILRTGEHSIAAIADPEAAEKYGLVVLRREIADNADNQTRFLVLGRKDRDDLIRRLLADKTSILIDRVTDGEPDSRTGKIQNALSSFAMRDIPVVRIHEHPVQGEPGQYSLFVDVRGGSADQLPMLSSLQALTATGTEWRELGTYQQGKVVR